MRNVFLFIRRYLNFFLFVIIQIVALMMLFRYNRFHQAAFMGVSGELTGRVSQQYNTVEYYFNLKKTNEELVAENTRLRNMLRQDFSAPDTSSQLVIDSIRVDSIEQFRRYLYLPAKVVGNNVMSQTNYITIARGSAQGVERDMAVVSPSGVVGTVVNVSRNMASVMSLLHRQSGVSASLARTGETGTVEWDGRDPQFITLKNIPRSAQVKVGDTIVTSKYSTFPPNQPVGYVAQILAEQSSNFYSLRLRPATNFFNVQFVYVVNNLQRQEQDSLEKATLKRER